MFIRSDVCLLFWIVEAVQVIMRSYLAVILFLAASATCHEEPEGAIGFADPEPRQSAGEVITLEDMSVYVVQPGQPSDGTKAVVWAHDIAGWQQGRTEALVDRLAQETEYLVLLPDFFRGVERPEAETYEWETSLQVFAGAGINPDVPIDVFFFESV